MPRDPALRDALANDDDFDGLLPEEARRRSGQYWTPVAVAVQAGAALASHGARSILDVGCGPGKFCLAAAASFPDARFFGVEQREALVDEAARLARRLGGRNAGFAVADATRVAWERFDGLYFFNPFAENIYDGAERYDATVELSAARFAGDLLRVERRLAEAAMGTVVVTYHGLGGPIPSCYDLVEDDPAGSDRLRTWVRARVETERWVWIEAEDGVKVVPRADLDRVLGALVGEHRARG